jgi:predicted nucleic acid-binding protein
VVFREHVNALFRGRPGTITARSTSISPGAVAHDVVSVLVKAQRLGSISADDVHGFLEDLRSLDILVDDESPAHVFGSVRHLAITHSLSGYDASYLELAVRKGLPLATLDGDLQKAIVAAGGVLLSPAVKG